MGSFEFILNSFSHCGDYELPAYGYGINGISINNLSFTLALTFAVVCIAINENAHQSKIAKDSSHATFFIG